MMRINLLPIKASRKQDTARQELLILGGVLAAVFVGLFALQGAMVVEVDDWNERVNAAKVALEAQKKDVTRVQEFKTKAELLETKLRVIDQLKAKKVGPARMLDELA